MRSISRKSFIKKVCYAGTCLCGFNTIVSANSKKLDEANLLNDDSMNDLSREWFSILLQNINEITEENEKKKIFKSCSCAHYAELDMDNILAPYKYNLKEFILFLEKEWGWKIKYNEKDKVIIADENKDICVCPLISNFSNSDLSFICHCSEGFAELIFSHVLGNPVSATVVSSILRGYKSCSYRIDI